MYPIRYIYMNENAGHLPFQVFVPSTVILLLTSEDALLSRPSRSCGRSKLCNGYPCRITNPAPHTAYEDEIAGQTLADLRA